MVLVDTSDSTVYSYILLTWDLPTPVVPTIEITFGFTALAMVLIAWAEDLIHNLALWGKRR